MKTSGNLKTSPAIEQQRATDSVNLSAQDDSRREFWLVLAALTVLYVVVVLIGNRRYVWFDELYTFDIARSGSLHELWYRVQHFDSNPPTVYVLSRISMSVLGQTPLGLRFPSMLEFYLGSVVILLYVKRKTGLAFATVAVLMLWAAGPTLYYAVEARPYALVFLAFGCLLLSWDTAIRTQPRRLALFGVATSTLALSVAHVFAPFVLFAFLVAEGVRFCRRRKPDYPLWTALLVPMLSMLSYIPLVRAYGELVVRDPASYNSIILFFSDTFAGQIMVFVVLAALVVPLGKRPETKYHKFLGEEVALFVGMLLSPILLILVLMHRHGMFYNRYGLASQAAILVALAIFLAYRVQLNRIAAYAVSVVLILAILKIQVWHVLRYPDPNRTGVLASVQPNLPIVVGEGRIFMEMNQYENAALLSRVFFLKDPRASIEFSHTNYFQNVGAPDILKRAGFPFTANVAPYSVFVQQHRQFLLLGGPTDWVFPKLLSNGASIAFVHDYHDAMLYFESTVYLVTMPPPGLQKEGTALRIGGGVNESFQ